MNPANPENPDSDKGRGLGAVLWIPAFAGMTGEGGNGGVRKAGTMGENGNGGEEKICRPRFPLRFRLRAVGCGAFANFSSLPPKLAFTPAVGLV